MIDGDYSESTSAYVASTAWLVQNAPTWCGHRSAAAMCEAYVEEAMREGGISPEEWNAACEGLADYAARKGEGPGPAPDFEALKR